MSSSAKSIRRLRDGFVKRATCLALREEMKKKDEELMATVEGFNILEGALKRKWEELELSKGVKAQWSDLQSQVVQLQSQLDGCQFEMERVFSAEAENA